MRRTIVVLGILLLLAGGLIARPAALGSSAAQGPNQPTPTLPPTKEPPLPTPTKPPAATEPPLPTPPPTVTMTKGTPPPTPTPGCVPLLGVELGGPEVCFVGLGCLFMAAPYPLNATTPTYTWSSGSLVGGQGTTKATYRWAATGPQTVAVAAANCGGAASDDLEVAIKVPVAQLYLPVLLRE